MKNTRYCSCCVSSEPMAYDAVTDTFYCYSCETVVPGTPVIRPLTRRDAFARLSRGRGRVYSRSRRLSATEG
jgi:hypothetical protein